MISVHFYDGKSSKRHLASLRLSRGQLYLAGEWGLREAPLSLVSISEPMGQAPRTLRFTDGAYCEVADNKAFTDLLAEAGYQEPVSVRLHKRWSIVIASMFAVVAVVVASYLWLLPAVADYAAPKLPQAFVAHISNATLASLDQHLLEASALPPQREIEIRRRMAEFAAQANLPAYKLHFRAAAKDMPPNAFALPDGDIVIFDALLEQLSDDEALAVFAHELGHVAHHHGLRMLIQSSVVASVVAVYLGDISSVVAALSTAMLQANYSQSFESEADHYAALALKRSGRSPMLLASALTKLAAAQGKTSNKEQKAIKEGGAEADHSYRWLSSHPSIERRKEALMQQAD